MTTSRCALPGVIIRNLTVGIVDFGIFVVALIAGIAMAGAVAASGSRVLRIGTAESGLVGPITHFDGSCGAGFDHPGVFGPLGGLSGVGRFRMGRGVLRASSIGNNPV
jgi:hypothetical protein